MESMDLSFRVAEKIAKIAQNKAGRLSVVFKGSFDKANRTSVNSPRGTGIDEGLKILSAVNRQFGLKTITDVHESCQCKSVGEVCDALQIPAFLCRQTDLLVAAANTGKAVKVQKGQ